MPILCQIVYHNGNCLNTKKPFARACRLCIEACPHTAISEYRELNTKQCTECGVCMAVCPSDGFVDRMMDELHNYLFSDQEQEIILNCPRAVPLGYEISCLGMLHRDLWSTLILLSHKKAVSLITGTCAECEDKAACAVSVQTFKSLHADWPGHSPVRILVKPDQGEEVPPKNDAPPTKSVARRDALGLWREQNWKKVEGWLPGLTAEETYPVPRTRRWLAEALQKNEEQKVPFWTLTVTDTCTSCGVCAAICPQGALEKRETDGKVRLVFEPFKCVQCNRCVEICRPKALTLTVKPFTHRLLMGKILLFEGSPRYCSRCGKQIFDNSEPPLCIACATNDPDKREFFL